MNELTAFLRAVAGATNGVVTPEALIVRGLGALLANPDILEGLAAACSHDAIDVATDALEAYRYGKLSKHQLATILAACLDDGNPPPTTRPRSPQQKPELAPSDFLTALDAFGNSLEKLLN